MYRSVFKRLLDITISFPVSLLLLPILIILAILIKIESRGPLFFTQNRVGKGLKIFEVLKLRTMTHEKREVGDKPLIGKAAGVTKVGFFLRRYKIDELPQVFNVLKGDMSIVGPRPSIPEQLDQMTEEEKRRYSVRPGLTGLAQVSGNIHLSWKERYKYDLFYINNISFLNDVRIILKTFLIIFKGEDKFVHKSQELIKHIEDEGPQ
jgi:lipopolysaccharide/colanic/teichoic acid biosynthesis glycosyltransferase